MDSRISSTAAGRLVICMIQFTAGARSFFQCFCTGSIIRMLVLAVHSFEQVTAKVGQYMRLRYPTSVAQQPHGLL
jgi:hypothetical protein